MNQFHPAWLAREQRRWLRPDHARFQKPQYAERKYSPDQPRLPAGSPGGGQWTSGHASGGIFPLPFDPDPDAFAAAAALDGDADFADTIEDASFEETESDSVEDENTDLSSTRRRTGTHFVNGQWLEATPAQLARFEVANARAQEAIGRLREVEPSWRPVPSVYGTGIESEIYRANNLAFEVQARITELGRVGIGPGSFAGESLPARGPERDFVMWERREINRIGTATGCHTCGTFDPGTRSGNFVIDHQLPTALQPLGQRLYPQCLTCSQRQGGAVHGVRR